MRRRGERGIGDWTRGDCCMGGDWTGRDCITILFLTRVCALAGRVYLYFTKLLRREQVFYKFVLGYSSIHFPGSVITKSLYIDIKQDLK